MRGERVPVFVVSAVSGAVAAAEALFLKPDFAGGAAAGTRP